MEIKNVFVVIEKNNGFLFDVILICVRPRLHKKQIKNKNKGDGRDKNRIKFIITSKNFSKTF